MINDGKQFEKDWRESVVRSGYFYYRLKDSAQAFGDNKEMSGLRFSLKNPFDCFIFANKWLFALELKSTKNISMSFYRSDFIDKEKRQTFMIKEHQIRGLSDASCYPDIVAGFILNFRESEMTYFWKIKDFLEFSENTDKKSFNEDDILKYNGKIVTQKKKIKRFTYDIKHFVNENTRISFNWSKDTGRMGFKTEF